MSTGLSQDVTDRENDDGLERTVPGYLDLVFLSGEDTFAIARRNIRIAIESEADWAFLLAFAERVDGLFR